MPNIVDRITVGNIDIVVTDTNPSIGGITLPIGAFGIALDGSGVFYKSGSLSTDWGKFLRNNDSASITAVGTITTGVWNGTAITDTYISSAANWNTAYSNRITSLTTTGNNGSSSLISNVLNIPTYTLVGLNGQPLNTNLTSISALSYVSSSFVKMTAAGTFSLDTNVYLINNQTITLSGDVTGSGTTSITTSILNTIVTGKLLTGYVSGAGTIAATDSILSAIQKLNGNVNAVVSGVSSVFGRTGAVVATSGDYTTTLVIEGTNLYFTNSRAISSLLTGYISGAGTIAATDSILSAIQKLNGNVAALVTGVSSVFGRTGNVVAASGDYTTTLVTEGTNLYFTNSRAISSLLTGYVSGAGIISATDSVLISIQKLNGNISALVTGVSSVNGLTGSVALTGTLNRLSISAANVFDISANYIGQSSITTLGTIISGVWNGTSILDTYISSASNWNIAYSNRITSLTTTGNSGAATLISNVLNIPTYTLAGLGGQPLNINLTSLSSLSYVSSSFVKMTAAGIFSLDTSIYLTTNQTITLSGDVTGSGTTTITTTIGAGKVTNTMLVNSSFFIGTTSISLGRISSVQALTGITSIDGSAATLTTARTISGTGEATFTTTAFDGSTAVSGVITLSNSAVINKVLTGYSSVTGTVSATDSILSAIQKLNGNIALVSGAVVYAGLWNASTNTPTLASGVGTKGTMYKVSVAGTTLIDGINQWILNDQIVFNGTTWDKLDGASNEVISVNGATGAVISTIVNNQGVTGSYTANALTLSLGALTGVTSFNGLIITANTGVITTGVWNGTSIVDTYISSASIWNAKQNALSGTGFVKSTAGVISYDTNTYLTANQTITLSGDITGSGATSIVTSISNATVTGKLLTGYISGAGTIAATDSILSAIQKLNGNVAALVTGVSSVFGRTGAVVATSGDYNTTLVTEGTNLYFTNVRAISSTLTGYISGAGTIAATDTVLSSIQKLNGNVAALVTGVSSVNGLTGSVALTGTLNRLTVSVANVFDISSSYIGQSSITTLGTIISGTWNGAAITDIYISSSSNWNTAYSNRITSLTTTGNSGSSTLISNVLNIPNYTLVGLNGQPLNTNLTSISALSYVSSSFVKMTAAGTFSLDNNIYLTANQTITLSGDVTGSGTTAITTTISNTTVTGKLITGYISGAGVISATDSILTSIQKLNGNIGALVTGVSSVFGRTGAVVATSGDYTTTLVTEGTNLYFTNSRAINSLLTGYISGAGVISATDSVLISIQKLNGNISALVTGVSSVFGRTGAVVATSGDYTTTLVTEGANLYFTNVRAIGSLLTGYISGAGTIAATDTVLGSIQKLNGNIGALITGVSSVFGRTGAVVATSGDYTTTLVTEGINLYFTNSRAIGSVLTGYVSGAGTISATDSILSAIQKLNGNITSSVSGVVSVSGTLNRITSTGGAMPIIDISASYVGQASLTTLGIISTGTWNGTLVGVIYGGTGTATQFTPGSILFSTTAGVYSQNNANLFWDNTNNRLGIGTVTPIGSIEVVGTSSPQEIYISRYSTDALTGGFIIRKARGTQIVPGAIMLNDNIATFGGRGYGTTGFSANNKISISFVSSENWSDTAQGTYIVFNTTTAGTITRTIVATLDNTGFTGVASYNGLIITANTGAITTGTWNGTSIIDTYISSASTWNAKQNALSGTGFVKSTAGVISYDTNTYLTANQTITLSGDVTGSGSTAITTTISNATVTGKLLTGYVSGAGTIAATDSILSAIQKLNGNISAATSGVTSVSGTLNRITSTGGSTPVIDISASYVGQSSITTLGTITTGVWTGTSISTTYTDAKIKGSVAATAGLIPFGTGVLDTLTSNAQLFFSTTNGLTVVNKSFFGSSTVPTALVDIDVSTTSYSSLRIRQSSAQPTVPNAGDIYNLNGTIILANTNLLINSTATPHSTLQANGSVALSYVTKSTTYTLTISDYVVELTGASFTVTLPTAVGIMGRIYIIKNTSGGIKTITTTLSQTIDGSTTQTISGRNWAVLQSTGINWIIIG